MKTVVINLIGSPGTGKSTLASELFSKMKWQGYDVELVSEYAKELVWEERTETFKNELYLFAKQHHRMFRLNNKVKYIITDRPLILSLFYNEKYGDKLEEFKNNPNENDKPLDHEDLLRIRNEFQVDYEQGAFDGVDGFDSIDEDGQWVLDKIDSMVSVLAGQVIDQWDSEQADKDFDEILKTNNND